MYNIIKYEKHVMYRPRLAWKSLAFVNYSIWISTTDNVIFGLESQGDSDVISSCHIYAS